MNFQAQPMSGAVEKTAPAALVLLGGIAAALEELLHLIVDLLSRFAWAHLAQNHLLPAEHRLPKVSLRVRGAATDDGARHIAKIAGARVTRKDIKDDQLI